MNFQAENKEELRLLKSLSWDINLFTGGHIPRKGWPVAVRAVIAGAVGLAVVAAAIALPFMSLNEKTALRDAALADSAVPGGAEVLAAEEALTAELNALIAREDALASLRDASPPLSEAVGAVYNGLGGVKVIRLSLDGGTLSVEASSSGKGGASEVMEALTASGVFEDVSIKQLSGDIGGGYTFTLICFFKGDEA